MFDTALEDWHVSGHNDWMARPPSSGWVQWMYRYPNEPRTLSVYASTTENDVWGAGRVQVSLNTDASGLQIPSTGVVQADGAWVCDDDTVPGYQRYTNSNSRYGIVDIYRADGQLQGVSVWPNDNDRILRVVRAGGVDVPPETVPQDIPQDVSAPAFHQEYPSTPQQVDVELDTTGLNAGFASDFQHENNILHADIQLFQDLLHEEALNRGWCSDYEAFIAKYNTRSQLVKLTGRPVSYRGTVSATFDFDTDRNGNARDGMRAVQEVIRDTLRGLGTLRNIEITHAERRL